MEDILFNPKSKSERFEQINLFFLALLSGADTKKSDHQLQMSSPARHSILVYPPDWKTKEFMFIRKLSRSAISIDTLQLLYMYSSIKHIFVFNWLLDGVTNVQLNV